MYINFAIQPMICGNIISRNFTDTMKVTILNAEEIQQTMNSDCEITFISSILLATVFITWVATSTLIIIVLLNKLKFKIKHKQQTENETLRISTKLSCNLESKTIVDTSDNVAYGMFTSQR